MMRLFVLPVSMKDQMQVKSYRLKVKCQYLYIIWPSVALVVIVISVECVYDIINSSNEALNTCVV